MSTPMSVTEVAAQIDPHEARIAVARVMAALGREFDWNSDTFEGIAVAVVGLAARSGLPSVADQDDGAIEFWQRIA